MTSTVAVGNSVKRRRFHLHCACGAIVRGREKTATCPNCGERVSFRRKIYAQPELLRSLAQELLVDFGSLGMFLLGWHLLGFAASVLMLGLVVLTLSLRTSSPRLGTHHWIVPDYQRRYRWFGRVVLLFAASSAIGYSVLPGKTFREQATFLITPEPHYCDWTWAPFGDKHCHYEPSFFHRDNGITIEWHRVND